MATKSNERLDRQVTPQPQEKPPAAGQPRVPHTGVKVPGGKSAEDDSETAEGTTAPGSARNETSSGRTHEP
jgi:hypothetical protein